MVGYNTPIKHYNLVENSWVTIVQSIVLALLVHHFYRRIDRSFTYHGRDVDFRHHLR